MYDKSSSETEAYDSCINSINLSIRENRNALRIVDITGPDNKKEEIVEKNGTTITVIVLSVVIPTVLIALFAVIMYYVRRQTRKKGFTPNNAKENISST